MGPLILFDKSFLQSLTEDESVWFGHFFSPIVCPLFYVETLADLDKDMGSRRTSEQEVRIIARKFPEHGGYPCAYHASTAMAELFGHEVPMDGQIPRSGGRMVKKDGQSGVVYDLSPEEKAFGRWIDENFHDVERQFAREWRAGLGQIRLDEHAKPLRELGIDARTCQSLEVARDLALSVVSGRDRHFYRMQLAVELLGIPRQYHQAIIKRWATQRYPSIFEYTPYVAHVVSVELFFLFALAANLIGSERASNRIDIAYLHYLPFCHVFVSNDRLHNRCAPLFLRDDQEFVWGPDLKADLGQINDHFMAFPDKEKDRGIMAFASRPPRITDSLTRHLRGRFLGRDYDDRPVVEPPSKDDPRSKELLDATKNWDEASEVEALTSDPEFMSIERRVRRKKGQWYQVPKDLQDNGEDD
jgi:hypothetical protein